jgi:transposase
VQVYFCDPKTPWQRGSNENTNGLLGQYFPKGTSIAAFTQAQLDEIAAIAAGDNPSRLRSEATFARLCGAAPIPATSGKTQHRHRLHRGGDRQANSALWRIALTRMSNDPDIRAYVTRRTQQGMSKREVMRCPKRYIARELNADLPQQMLA